MHMYYDPVKALRDSEALYEQIEKEENELRNMEEPPDRKYHYDKYFYINRSKNGKLGFVKNHKAIDEALAKCGFFVIAETDFGKTTAEILKLYRNRDVIEKSFDELKNDLDFKMVQVHNEETLHGKIFASFIALIVKSYIQNHIEDNSLTHKRIILELDKIKIFDMHGRFLDAVLRRKGISTKGLVFDKKVFTTLAFVNLSETGERDFSFARKPGADTRLSKSEVKYELIKNDVFETVSQGELNLIGTSAFRLYCFQIYVAKTI